MEQEAERIEDASREGWLDRRTWYYTWSKRFFVLDGQTMSWFSDDKKRRSLGKLDVDRARSELEPKSLIFKITLRDGGKSYRFRAASENERSEWNKLINAETERTKTLLQTLEGEDECVNCTVQAAMDGAPIVHEEEKESEGSSSGTDKEESESQKIAQCKVKDTSGTIHLLQDVLSKSNLTLVGLLRHFG
eukprot:TRINITY_DN19642_c0_g1_i1.p1 TRINITY_DN19642_c0_g1~~TRINITY_DN19642_c0_g1_i1.p1  ORF type:complete len:191 (+),score=51.32 TRINITY_DN19642_c0_g1_i1:90-662(+)